jgi:hypothetical protein
MFAPDHQPRCCFIATSLQPTHKVAAIPIKAKRGEEETGKSRMFTYVQHAQDKTVESRSGQGAEKYFDVALKTGDYYTKGIGTWGGRGGELSGAAGWGVGRLSHRRRLEAIVSQTSEFQTKALL